MSDKKIKSSWSTWLPALVSPLVATGIALMLLPVFPVANLAMLYVVAVLITGAWTSTGPAVACAVLSFAAYNFVLTEPYFSLMMLHREDFLTGLMLIVVALITGSLAARLNEQVAALRASEAWSDQQMQAAQAFSSAIEGPAVVEALASELQRVLKWHANTCSADQLPSPIKTAVRDITLEEDSAGITVVMWDSEGHVASALRLAATEPMTSWHRERTEALIRLARLAWGRVQLTDSLRQERLHKEREQLRSALLSSISHDLRTPLATMIGSVSSLIDLSENLGAAEREELLNNTLSESLRLDRYIQNLLDMTRLGHGELTLDRDWVGLDEIIGVVHRRSKPLLNSVRLNIHIPENLPLLLVHPALIEQAIFNVLENSIRFSPENGTINIQARQSGNSIELDISDCGPGVLPEDRERIFDMFHTASGDNMPSGIGLGLTICRSILAAHGGSVTVSDNPDSPGATFTLRLPIPESERTAQEEACHPSS